MRNAMRAGAVIWTLAAVLSRQYPDVDDPVRGGLAEFLAWAHPATAECSAPDRIEIVERWPGVLRVRYEIPCGTRQVWESILETREGEGVWQVAGGFETAPDLLERALAVDAFLPPTGGPDGATEDPDQTAGAAPPGDDRDGVREEIPMGLVDMPVVESEVPPEFPEEAGRARLIGRATVELLVDVTPDGTPTRVRPLRGPDPDLGMRGAAIEAILRWRFLPASLSGRPVRSFTAISIPFQGLPPETRTWVHRALFHIEAFVWAHSREVDEARRRLAAGEPFPDVVAALGPTDPLAGDRGLVPADSLPAAVRGALHEARVGTWVGPIEAGGRTYLLRKRAEVYYAIRSVAGGEVSYQIVHQRNAPGKDDLRRAIESDVAGYLAETRRFEYANEAARVMGIAQRRSAFGQLLIHTDVLQDDEIDLLGRVVEETIRVHEEFWSDVARLRPFTEQILVYAFARESDHDRLYRIWDAGKRDGGATPAGEYTPASRILAIPCEATGGHLPVPVLIHEAIHMLDYERVYEEGVEPSEWFEEGFANYFGLSQFDSRLRLDPGEIRRSGTVTAGGVRVQFDPRAELRQHLRRRRDEGTVPLRRLLEANATSPLWGGERSSRAYGAAWTLVHFLIHGDGGSRRDTFLKYARLESRGEGGPEAFRRLFGPDLGALEEAWHTYEERL